MTSLSQFSLVIVNFFHVMPLVSNYQIEEVVFTFP